MNVGGPNNAPGSHVGKGAVNGDITNITSAHAQNLRIMDLQLCIADEQDQRHARGCDSDHAERFDFPKETPAKQ